MLVTAFAPVVWGSTYVVTHAYLPADSPLWGATLRALPAGLVLLLIARRLPRGHWWWRSILLGVLNIGAFFVLLYIAAQTLPSGVASSIMAAAPVVMMLMAWALVSERPTVRALVGAATGILGVTLIVSMAATAVDPWGVAASVTAMVMSSFGFVLTKRWRSDAPLVASTAWQVSSAGLLLLVVALAVEGAPPALDGAAVAGFAYVSLAATALAFVAWFAGLARLRAGTVGIIGLLNPVSGVALGALVAGERLTGAQLVGIAAVVAGIAVATVGGRRPVAEAASTVAPPTLPHERAA
ncbi:EamA family transporter [Serinibacter arcticus]|uniref:EamA family transporter n=2 Tax=Serinibacter arcticus TaxID=1655435 RepID=A0A2U1ZT50_9MICO|nr:EamA family transporter [Serinibacter arcticus]